ncbi:MAG: hypothetical protein A2301_03070 [Candidatus Magasanikbacteria bacterium RIFOXYB2_FULL_40_13]|uniref:Uncharacterized protein n=2 Tax=Candidatus Magasanikiibacteriota TaxID=1752731 RepID=A0A1F6NH06_9BACT|nr:MAG: hypothetical protein A2373_01755 [Candidatus Magasanikbacteria bacterium RIFOXYB1_FULL_40_15]OGH86816.1 MAG: hypothetical protein A2301_03070 [Candidatus Magasanikbacteria bacterium RIFOXYB2_FULL_40_13]OGH87191.1 MAG: hypothetical protein A2206_00325 [Candidatus Magasanikbacteria bacterium RIFOXYA1_FULL_40_8]
MELLIVCAWTITLGLTAFKIVGPILLVLSVLSFSLALGGEDWAGPVCRVVFALFCIWLVVFFGRGMIL